MFKDVNLLLVNSAIGVLNNTISSIKTNFIEEYGEPSAWSTTQMVEYHKLLVPILKSYAELVKAKQIIEKE